MLTLQSFCPPQVAPHLEQAADNAADVITTSAAVVAEHAQPVAEDVAAQVSSVRSNERTLRLGCVGL